MKSSRLANVFFFLVAPPVLALAGLGLWLAFEGSVENYKFGVFSSKSFLPFGGPAKMRYGSRPTPQECKRMIKSCFFRGMSAIERRPAPRPNAERQEAVKSGGQPLEIVFYASVPFVISFTLRRRPFALRRFVVSH
jgi:hypothetical protein